MNDKTEQFGPVTVIGAGVMGRGIALAAAVAGARVSLADADESQLSAARSAIESDLAEGVRRNKLAVEEVRTVLESIRTSTDTLAACGDARLVIEAVVERIDVKHEVLRLAEAGSDSSAVIATNTSSISVTEIISCLRDPSRGVGMHFFNPVSKMKLIEIVQGLQTSDATLEAANRAASAMGKTSVHVNDLPGFATSRINILIGNEAMRMLDEGVASAHDIDAAIRLGLNHPMGPLELGDLVGWDTRLDILEYLAARLGDRFRPTNYHRKLVAAGRYGRKSGQGVFTYDG